MVVQSMNRVLRERPSLQKRSVSWKAQRFGLHEHVYLGEAKLRMEVLDKLC